MAQEATFVETDSYTVSHEDFTELTSADFKIMMVDSVKGLPDCRYVLFSPDGVVCLSGTGRLLASAIAGERELIAMSSDASTIARLSWSEGLDKPLRLSVESADGRVLWRRNDGYGRGETAFSAVRVTSSGYVIVTPNVPPPEAEGLTRVRGNLESPLILDDNGQVVVELPVITTGSKFFDALSAEGEYYAINFNDTESDVVEGIEGGLDCLALFEVRTGREVWRHYFGNRGYGRVAIGPGAGVVVSAGQDKPELDGEVRNGEVIYFFDKQGNVIGKRQMFDDVRNLILSPNGAFAAMTSRGDVVKAMTVDTQRGDYAPVRTTTVSVKYDSLFVFDAQTGSLMCSVVPEPVYTGKVGDLAIGNNASVLASATLRRGPLRKQRLMTFQLMDLEGVTRWQAEWEIDRDRPLRYGLAPTGRQLLKVQSSGAVVRFDQR